MDLRLLDHDVGREEGGERWPFVRGMCRRCQEEAAVTVRKLGPGAAVDIVQPDDSDSEDWEEAASEDSAVSPSLRPRLSVMLISLLLSAVVIAPCLLLAIAVYTETPTACVKLCAKTGLCHPSSCVDVVLIDNSTDNSNNNNKTGLIISQQQLTPNNISFFNSEDTDDVDDILEALLRAQQEDKDGGSSKKSGGEEKSGQIASKKVLSWSKSRK